MTAHEASPPPLPPPSDVPQLVIERGIGGGSSQKSVPGRGAREDLIWREQAHARGHFTNLDGIPAVLIYIIHLLRR